MKYFSFKIFIHFLIILSISICSIALPVVVFGDNNYFKDGDQSISANTLSDSNEQQSNLFKYVAGEIIIKYKEKISKKRNIFDILKDKKLKAKIQSTNITEKKFSRISENNQQE
ncbi:MAG: hypothetical protein U9R14_02490, partial [Patescibacteria group bacterium]|nr:hypothetical protein [Patescibacteria group bacterium]